MLTWSFSLIEYSRSGAKRILFALFKIILIARLPLSRDDNRYGLGMSGYSTVYDNVGVSIYPPSQPSAGVVYMV